MDSSPQRLCRCGQTGPSSWTLILLTKLIVSQHFSHDLVKRTTPQKEKKKVRNQGRTTEAERICSAQIFREPPSSAKQSVQAVCSLKLLSEGGIDPTTSIHTPSPLSCYMELMSFELFPQWSTEKSRHWKSPVMKNVTVDWEAANMATWWCAYWNLKLH